MSLFRAPMLLAAAALVSLSACADLLEDDVAAIADDADDAALGNGTNKDDPGTSPQPGPTSDPAAPPADPEEPPPPAAGDLELIGDPTFTVSSLPADTQVWYNRFLAALDNSKQYPNIKNDAGSGDTYLLGRTVATDVTTTLTIFRLTGDLRLLDRVDQIMQIARAQLKDTNGDGYLNWRWLKDSKETTYYGKDNHVMDEIMSHMMVAQVAWAFHQNEKLTSPSGVDYKERATFWANYRSQWEAKWRARNNKPTGFPFIQKHLTHPHLYLTRFHWYSHRLTNDQGHLNEAKRLANEMNTGQLTSITTPNGPGFVFPHGVVKHNPSVDYLAPLNYAEYSTQSLMDLAFEPFDAFTPETTLVPLANTIATKVIDNGSTDFAPTIGGSTSIGGIPILSGMARTANTRWAIYPLGEFAAFDKSNTINTVNQQVYDKLEGSPNNPTRIAIPAAMIIKDLIK